MCDTVVYVGDNKVLFAKNSDREVDEPQVLLWQSRRTYSASETLKCTYIDIPQVRETYAILVSKPTWMWGAEMGTNEFGVTIGNEAVFTNQPYNKTGLTGMDLLRLALERSTTAKHACEIIITLIETYGQGGNCGYKKTTYYHNSFLIADPHEAYVLETANKHYDIEKVQGCRAISNGLTINKFKQKFSDPIKSYFTRCFERKTAVEHVIAGRPTLSTLFSALRMHKNENIYPQYHWLHGGMDAPCMHAGGLFLNYQTTASWVAELTPQNCSHWVTATSTPCISLFKPVNPLKPLSDRFCTDHYELKESFWWMHDTFQKIVMKNPRQTFAEFIEEKNQIEHKWLATPPDPEFAFTTHKQLIRLWTQKLQQIKIKDTRPFWARRF